MRTLLDTDESLQPLDRSQYRIDAPKIVRQPRVLRVAGEPDLVLLGDRNDTFEEVGDAFPVVVRLDPACARLRFALFPGIGESPGAVAGSTAAGSACGSWHSEQRGIVLHALHTDGGAVFDVFLEALNVAVALRAFSEHDGRTIHGVDGRRVEKRLPHHGQGDLRLFAQVANLGEFLDGPVAAFGVLRIGTAAD